MLPHVILFLQALDIDHLLKGNIAAQGLESAALLAVQHLEFQLSLYRHLIPLVLHCLNLYFAGVQHDLLHIIQDIRYNKVIVQGNLRGHVALPLVHMYLLLYQFHKKHLPSLIVF